jgi:hypothetical protein
MSSDFQPEQPQFEARSTLLKFLAASLDFSTMRKQANAAGDDTAPKSGTIKTRPEAENHECAVQ